MKWLLTILLLLSMVGCNSFNRYNLSYDNHNTTNEDNILPSPIVTIAPLSNMLPTLTPIPERLVIPVTTPISSKVVVKRSDLEATVIQYDLCPRKAIVDLKRAPPIPFKELDVLKAKFKNKPVEYQKAVIELLTEHISGLYSTVKYNRDLVTERDQSYKDSCNNFRYKVVPRKF